VHLLKMTGEGKIGTVIPDHDELKPGTLKGVLKLAKIEVDDFTGLSDICYLFYISLQIL
jgi:hypothetical protein